MVYTFNVRSILFFDFVSKFLAFYNEYGNGLKKKKVLFKDFNTCSIYAGIRGVLTSA